MDLPYPILRPTGELVERRTVYEVTAKFELTLPMGRGTYTFEIPEGFKTDLGSVPWIFWWIISPTDPRFTAAFLVHDQLYKCDKNRVVVKHGDGDAQRGTHDVSRFFADALLREIANIYGAPWWMRMAAYLAVRIGGWAAYRSLRSPV